MLVTIFLKLTGPREGDTVELNDLQFTDGIATYTGSEPEAESLLRYFSRSYAVIQVDKDGNPVNPPKEETEDGVSNQPDQDPNQSLQGNGNTSTEPEGNGSNVVEGGDDTNLHNENGQTDAPVAPAPQLPVDERLRNALNQLDPENDEHWTKLGKPAIAALEPIYGSGGFTREDVEAALPDFSRDIAREQRKNQGQ